MSCRILVLCLVLAACGGERVYHEDEDFAADKRHRHEFAVSNETACEAARHALIGQGYVVARNDETREIVLVGQKEFKEKEKRHATLQIQVVCGNKTKGSVLYAVAVENHFDVAQNKESKSFGVPIVSPISISSSTDSQSQLKLSGETVDDDDFYKAFFKAVERELK